MSKTKIEWSERVWNPIRGCSPVSPGCKNCFAKRMAARNLPGMKSPATGETFAVMTRKEDGSFSAVGPHWTGKVELIESMLDIPLRRHKPTTYFVNSMADLFHEALPEEAIDRVFAVMALCPQHQFQVLTKRAERMREYFSDIPYRQEVVGILAEYESGLDRHFDGPGTTPGYGVTWRMPLPNVRLGVSVEDQQRADERIPELMKLAAMGWKTMVSAEPLLGPINLESLGVCRDWRDGTPDALPKIGWVIVGGESGPGARPMHPDWPRAIRDQCVAAGVPFFFKQWGEFAPYPYRSDPGGIRMERVGKKAAGHLLDGREWREMPQPEQHHG